MDMIERVSQGARTDHLREKLLDCDFMTKFVSNNFRSKVRKQLILAKALSFGPVFLHRDLKWTSKLSFYQ